MRYTPLDLLGGSNVDDNVAWSREDTINYIPQKASSSGARTEHEFRDAPGLKPFVMGPTGAGPVRGSHDCEGKHFVVMGSTFYQITTAGVAIPIGTIPGTQRVNIAHNQIVGGNEVIITTGTPNGYVYNTVTQVFGRITDPGYPGGGSVDYIDTYLVSVEPYGRYWFWSDQANATSYNTLNRTEAESDPDSIVGLAVNSFEVVVFGQNTVEFFYNAGGINGSTFRSKKVMNNHGCAARDSIVKLDNSLFWLGVDGILYRLNGYQAQPISSPQFTQRIAGLNWAKAFAFAYEDQGHVIYYITFPDGQTFGYDVTTGLTVRRESYGLNRWRLNTLTKVGRNWIGGDFQSGRLYTLDWNYPMEGEGTPLVRERVTGNVANNQNKIEVPLVELLFQTGTPEVEPVMFVEQPEGPTIGGAYPDGTIGELHSAFPYVVAGGTPPYNFTNRPGNNPAPGIGVMASSGIVPAGTPTAAGSYSHFPRVTDVNGLYSEMVDPYAIEEAPIDWLMLTNSVNPLLYGEEGDWSGPQQPSPGSINWQVAGWGNGELLMSDRGSNVALSANKGASWTVSTLPATVSGNKGYVLYANGYWWIPSGTLTEVQRGDGITFTQPASGAAAEGEAIAAVTGDPLDTLVMVGSGSAKASFTTNNGTSWAYGAGDMRAGGSVPTRIGIASNGTRLVIGGAFVGGGVAHIAYSDDAGGTWTSVTVPFVSGTPSYVTYRGGRFIVGSTSGEVCYSEAGAVFTLTGATGTILRHNGIDYDGTRYTSIWSDTITEGYMAESLDDMATWTPVTPTSLDDSQYDIVAMNP